MTESTALPAPIFEYVQLVVEVSKLPDPAVAKIPEYTLWRPGDIVWFEATTSAGNWSKEIQLASDSQFPLPFAIPKSLFEKGLGPDATATLTYKVITGGGNPSPPQTLTLSLRP